MLESAAYGNSPNSWNGTSACLQKKGLFRMVGGAGFQPRRQVGNPLTPNPLPLPKRGRGCPKDG